MVVGDYDFNRHHLSAPLLSRRNSFIMRKYINLLSMQAADLTRQMVYPTKVLVGVHLPVRGSAKIIPNAY
jgi:hypothetical protein